MPLSTSATAWDDVGAGSIPAILWKWVSAATRRPMVDAFSPVLAQWLTKPQISTGDAGSGQPPRKATQAVNAAQSLA